MRRMLDPKEAGGGNTAKLYKHTITASSNGYGDVKITFYNYNNAAINSRTKLTTALQSIGEVAATGYITSGSYVYIVFSAFFDKSSNNTVRASLCKIDIKSGNVSKAF